MFQPTSDSKRVRVNRLVFFIMSGFRNQVIRPLEMRLNADLMNGVFEATQGARNTSAAALSMIAPQILTQTGQIQGVAEIPGTWGGERAAFMLDVSLISDFSSIEQRSVITGYTDHAGFQQMQMRAGQIAIDPNMRLYFNNISQLAVRQVPTPAGVGQQLCVRSSEQVMRPTSTRDNPNQLSYGEYTMRPVDVMSVSGSAEMMQTNGQFVENYHASMYDGIKLADRRDFASANYLSNTITKYARAATEVADDVVDAVTITESASRMLNSSPVYNNQLIALLSNQYHFNDVNGDIGSISYRDLCNMDPGADSRVQTVRPTQAQRANRMAQVNDSRDWGGADQATMAASLISAGLPTLMITYLLGSVRFTVTNDTINGQPLISWENIQGFSDGIDVTSRISSINDLILTEIYNPVSRFGNDRVSIRVNCDVNTFTDIAISINGSPLETFSSLTAADQLFSPMMSHNYSHVAEVAIDLLDLSRALSDANQGPNMTAPVASPVINQNIQGVGRGAKYVI